jgi:signal peptidase II
VKTKTLILSISTPLVIVLDQLTKILARVYLKPLLVERLPSDRYLTVIEDFFRLKFALNPGAAWSIGANWSSEFRMAFFVVATLIAIIAMLWILYKLEAHQRLQIVAIALVLGGAIGNLIDRMYMGEVIDFIDWFFLSSSGEHHWPTFNIADIGISVGIGLLFIDMLLTLQKEKHGKKTSKSQPS